MEWKCHHEDRFAPWHGVKLPEDASGRCIPDEGISGPEMRHDGRSVFLYGRPVTLVSKAYKPEGE